jgi:nicotinate (nicotinamide) nucleotide adenylyltransferase
VHGDYGKQGLAPAVHRLRMAHIAVGDSEWIGISEWEATRTRYSRSVEVARHVKETYGEDVTVVFVCGSDVLKAMTDKEMWTTQSIQSLLNEVVLAVTPRPGVNLEALLQDQVFDGFHDRVWNVEGIFSAMSSSTIRCVYPTSAAIVPFANELQGAIIQFH